MCASENWLKERATLSTTDAFETHTAVLIGCLPKHTNAHRNTYDMLRSFPGAMSALMERQDVLRTPAEAKDLLAR